MLKEVCYLTVLLLIFTTCSNQESFKANSEQAHAVLVPGSGTYSRKISTQNPEAQAFFDQGLRLAWGFYFPESIASFQEAARLDPDQPMHFWGMAYAMGPNPNSRYARMPDDPKGEGLKAIKKALDRIDRASPVEAKLIRALHVFYDQQTIPDQDDRDQAYLTAMLTLTKVIFTAFIL